MKIRLFTIAPITLFCSTVYATHTLNFIGDVNFKTGTLFKDSIIGGLSGLDYDPSDKTLFAISDDRGGRGTTPQHEPRFYKFNIKLEQNKFEVTPQEVTYLKMSNDTFKSFMLDPEGIAKHGDKWLISSEGFVPIVPPAVFIFSNQGILESQLEIPEKFLNKGFPPLQTQGPINNKVYECLTLSENKQLIYTATEQPLKQDSFIANDGTGVTRIIEYRQNGDEHRPAKEYGYPITVSEKYGLVDFIAVAPDTLLTMERDFNKSSNKSSIYIYEATLRGATDLSLVNEIKNLKGLVLVEKKLILNLDTIIPSLSKEYQQLDNFEGITIGPTLPNGNRSVIIVSDNNFKEKQRTAFIAFELN